MKFHLKLLSKNIENFYKKSANLASEEQNSKLQSFINKMMPYSENGYIHFTNHETIDINTSFKGGSGSTPSGIYGFPLMVVWNDLQNLYNSKSTNLSGFTNMKYCYGFIPNNPTTLLNLDFSENEEKIKSDIKKLLKLIPVDKIKNIIESINNNNAILATMKDEGKETEGDYSLDIFESNPEVALLELINHITKDPNKKRDILIKLGYSGIEDNAGFFSGLPQGIFFSASDIKIISKLEIILF